MKYDRLFKYKLGLAAIGVFVFVLFVMVVVQSGAVKHDNELYKQADKISTKLNDYTNKHNRVPVSLSAAGINDASGDITYTRLSSTRYKFCMNYKHEGDNYGAAYHAIDWYYGDYGGSYGYSNDDEIDYLYIHPAHRKGENCQTVKIYSSNYYDDFYKSNSTDNTRSL